MGWFAYLSIIILPISIALLVCITFIFNLPAFILSLLITIIILGFIITNYVWIKINKEYIKGIPDDYKIDEKKEFFGIVITTSNLAENKYFFIYASGIILLIDYFKRKKQPFKIIKERDEKKPFNKKKFHDLVNNPKCTRLYILGHGRRYGLKISDNELFYYFLLSGAPDKQKVVQLHCNHENYRSLSELLNAEPDLKQNNERLPWQNIRYFLKITK